MEAEQVRDVSVPWILFLIVLDPFLDRAVRADSQRRHFRQSLLQLRGKLLVCPQLTSCLDRLRQEDGFAGYVVRGRRFDVGLPDAYRRAVIEFREA